MKHIARQGAILLALLFLGERTFATESPFVGLYAHGNTNSAIYHYYQSHPSEVGEPTNANSKPFVRFISGGGFAVKAQDFAGGTHGPLTLFDSAGPEPWFMNRICVPFNNSAYDVQYGGAHDMDVQTPLGTPITSIVSGSISSVTHPTWGWQIGIKLDKLIRGNSYAAYLHLGAVKPGLAVGQRVAVGDLLAYSGGANSVDQMNGKTNTPFGPQFVDDASQSSQPQTGFAVMRGPQYGVGAGWTKLPDPALDPAPTLMAAQADYKATHQAIELNDQHGLRLFYFQHNGIAAFGPPKDNEHMTSEGTEQNFALGKLSWNKSTGQIMAEMRSNPGQ